MTEKLIIMVFIEFFMKNYMHTRDDYFLFEISRKNPAIFFYVVVRTLFSAQLLLFHKWKFIVWLVYNDPGKLGWIEQGKFNHFFGNKKKMILTLILCKLAYG
jgi:hypothetical protein